MKFIISHTRNDFIRFRITKPETKQKLKSFFIYH